MKQELDVIALQPVYEKPTDQVRLARPGLALDNAEGMGPRRIRQSQKDSLLIAPINLAGMAARYFEISYRRVGCQDAALVALDSFVANHRSDIVRIPAGFLPQFTPARPPFPTTPATPPRPRQ